MEGYNPRAFAAAAPHLTLVPALALQDTVWQTGMTSFDSNGGQFILPASYKYSLPAEVIKELEWRVSQVTGYESFSFVEPRTKTFRILGLTPVTTSALAKVGSSQVSVIDTPLEDFVEKGRAKLVNNGQRSKTSGAMKVVKSKSEKVPRPPNAFILYRQYYHPIVLADNPEFHNNEISKFVGQQWKSEPQAIIDQWKAKALARKLEHQAMHPDYQYSPRKPGEKKQRASRKKHEKSYSHPPKDYANWNHFTENNTGMPFIDHHDNVFDAPTGSIATAQASIMSETPARAKDIHWQGSRDVGVHLPVAADVNLQKAVDVQNFRANNPCDPVQQIDDGTAGFYQGGRRFNHANAEDVGAAAVHNENSFMAACLDFDKLAHDLAVVKGCPAAERAVLERLETGNDNMSASDEGTRTKLQQNLNNFVHLPQAGSHDIDLLHMGGGSSST